MRRAAGAGVAFGALLVAIAATLSPLLTRSAHATVGHPPLAPILLAVRHDDALGVTVTAPDGSRVDIATPSITPTHAAGVFVTERGRIPISWSRSAGTFSLDVTIPDDIIATVHIPAASVADVSDGHSKLTDAPGVTDAHTANREVVLTAGPGHYDFHVPSRTPRPTNPFPWTVLVFAPVGALAFAQLAVMRARRKRDI